jgi:DNA repair photolyase
MLPPVRAGDDPTAAVLSESALSVHGVCDYVVNVATGCRHGCTFCYVPSTPPIRARKEMVRDHAGVESPGDEWGGYVLYRDDLADRLDAHLDRKRTWHETDRGRGIVGLSFSTDPYMDDRAAAIATDVVRVLAEHGKHVRVLTRNPSRALRDLEVFRNAGEYVTIGTSIPSLDPDAVRALEPRAPTPSSRLRALQSFADAGVQVYVSASPSYPHQDEAGLRRLLERLATVDPEVVFHEPFNARSARMATTRAAARDRGPAELATALDRLTDTAAWIEYAVRHSRQVQAIAEEVGLPVHLCPHHQLVQAADGEVEAWFRSWRERSPPERFAGGSLPDGPQPAPPTE